MERTYWHKQTPDKPLFADLLWSQPENKSQAGKLLIVGGNLHGFAAPAEAYAAAQKAGIGYSKVLLPDKLKKTVGQFLENTEYAPATPSGSFGASALAEMLDLSSWADGVLLAGDLGRNSETAIVLEKFVSKNTQPITLTKDAVEYFFTSKNQILEHPNTLLVLTIAQLQKLALVAKFPIAISYGMDLLNLIDALHTFTQQFPVQIITKQNETILTAVSGQVSTTKLENDLEKWRIVVASWATTWWLQNPRKPFEALTASLCHKY